MANYVFVIAIIIVALSAIQSTSITFTERDLETEESLKNLFEKWVAHHGLEKDLDNKAERFNIFKDNVKYIHEFNKQGHSYHLGLNQFGAMTNEEFRNMYAGGKIDRQRITRSRAIGGRYMYEKVEDDISITCFDWRQKGAVNPIKDQDQCDCGGTFSAVASVESMLFIRNVTEKLLSLSEQELVDCGFFTHGCSGASVNDSFVDIILKGLTTESDYPYTGKQGTCKSFIPVANISGVEFVTPNNRTAFTIAVHNQPISVAIDASSLSFQLYNGGIFDDESCGFNTTHAVTVVGYCNSIGGDNYWIVRNSWGTSWGEGGYIRIKSDVRYASGLCGILTDPSYPIPTNIPSPPTSTYHDSFSVE
ncbi:Cysteine protease [Rhynchospora pubera]|uniref:Cysteine protease n=1 Tax=Rhynchospora pubera TaxID=906938 RepID=A0AAV8EHN2_9POAL|nr:Cysteine protease [Rhynchospora pubera]KAJ4779695.1 Cysteine protease [Rhynchospora pubera]KAJ4807745.1 Cysteine protease [Rhynchospora pubera]